MRIFYEKPMGALGDACSDSGGEWNFDNDPPTCDQLKAVPPTPAPASSSTAVYVVLAVGLVGLAVYFGSRA